jgi:hypothetical protein
VGGEYHAAQAQRLAERRRRERPLTRKMDDPAINLAVREGLAHNWAPEQIAGRMKQQQPDEPLAPCRAANDLRLDQAKPAPRALLIRCCGAAAM